MSKVQVHRPGEFSDAKRNRMMQAVSEDAPSRANVFRRAYAGQASPRQAIKAHCLECCWMEQSAITECTATGCPLWNYRPYQGRGARLTDEETPAAEPRDRLGP